MKKTTIMGINLLIVVILLAIMIYPLKPEIGLKEREVRFRWFGVYKGYTLYVDDNREFTSPMMIKTERKNYPIELEPGIYFWKISAGRMSSPVKRLELDSDVSVKVKNNSLENDGNIDLNISLETPTGAIILDLPYKDRVKIENNSNITAKQK